MKLSIQKFSENILKDMVILGESFYPKDHLNLSRSYLDWILNKNPFGLSLIATAYEGNVLIGMISLIPLVLSNGRDLKQCYFAINVLTHPQHRNKNIFLKLADICISYCSENSYWLLGHPNRLALPGWTRKKMNFRGRLLPRLKFPSFSFFSKDVIKVTSEDMIPAFDTTGCVGGWHINYTKEFLEWRYFSTLPGKKYEIFIIKNKTGQTTGFFSCRQFKFGIKLLVDYFYSEPGINVSHPTSFLLAMLPKDVSSGGISLPFDKSIPFFVTTYGSTECNTNFDALTLGATDL